MGIPFVNVNYAGYPGDPSKVQEQYPDAMGAPLMYHAHSPQMQPNQQWENQQIWSILRSVGIQQGPQ